jgi:hypothetical protein
MKFCQSHWDALRSEIARVGLDKFVAKDGNEAIEKLKGSLVQAESLDVDKPSPSFFEPLMSAHWAIVNNVISCVGLRLMVPNEDGTGKCPLCFIAADHLEHCRMPDCKIKNYDEWIIRAVADELEHAKSLGLVIST